MTDDPMQKRPDPKPGDILPPGRDWSDQDVAEMKAYIDEHEPGLWEQLVEVERTTGDFRGLDIMRKVKALVLKKHRNAGRSDYQSMMMALRVRWQSTIN